MSARMPGAPLLLVLCLLPLLLAQVLGVHHHRHLALDGAAHHTEVHLADTGLHFRSPAADAAHDGHADHPAHLHFDLERPAVAKGLMKILTDLPTVGLVLLLALLLPLGSGLVLRRHTPRRPAKRRPPRYLLTPPALAPPR